MNSGVLQHLTCLKWMLVQFRPLLVLTTVKYSTTTNMIPYQKLVRLVVQLVTVLVVTVI